MVLNIKNNSIKYIGVSYSIKNSITIKKQFLNTCHGK